MVISRQKYLEETNKKKQMRVGIMQKAEAKTGIEETRKSLENKDKQLKKKKTLNHH